MPVFATLRIVITKNQARLIWSHAYAYGGQIWIYADSTINQ